MPSGNFTADETTRKFIVTGDNGVHVGFSGSFGGGSIAVNKIVAGASSPLYDAGVAIAYTAADDDNLLLVRGDAFELDLTGSTTPAIQWTVEGAQG